MKGRKTMSKINREKWARMRSILDKLKEQPMELSQIEHLVYKQRLTRVGKRTVQNYLAELQGLGLVDYNKEKRMYYFIGLVKQTFSTHEHKLALKHSERLIFTREDYQGLDQWHEDTLLENLIRHPEHSLEISCLMQHFKTGYYGELWAPLQKFRELMEKYDIPIVPTSLGLRDAESGYGHSIRKPFEKLPQEDKKSLLDLKKHFLQTLYGVMFDVKHGVPLKGWCDHCPTRSVSIKG